MRGVTTMRTAGGVVVGVLLGLLPARAEALVIPGCPESFVASVPVGGWVPLPDEYAHDVSVTANGEPVTGEVVQVEGLVYWQPAQMVPSGTLLEFRTERCDGSSPGSSSVLVRVEGSWLPPEVDFAPLLTVVLDETEPTEHVTCGRDEALLVEAGYCCADCSCPEAANVPTSLAEVWRGDVQWLGRPSEGFRGQVLLRQLEWFGTATPEKQWEPLDWWSPPSRHDVEVGEEPLCTTFELVVVPTGERTELRHCVDPPTTTLESQPVVPRFGRFGIASCHLPPEGLEDVWCASFRAVCTEARASERNALLCRHHHELCGTKPLPDPIDPDFPGASGGSGGTFGNGASGGSKATGGASASEEGPGCRCDEADGGGCSMKSSPSSVGLGGVGGAILLLLGYLGVVRRTSSRQAECQPSSPTR